MYDFADQIIRKADELFPELYAKAPDIGGKENLMAYNLDLMILSASFYEASDHRIDGPAINEMAKEIFAKYGFGEVENAEISVDSFGQLAEILN